MGQFQPGQSGNPAGRPRKADRYASEAQATYDQIAANLPALLAGMLRAALAGSQDVHEDVDEEWIPFQLVTTRDSEGAELPMFTPDSPEVNDQGMVCVKRKIKRSTRQKAANTQVASDLLDRLLGKPVSESEPEETGDTKTTIQVVYTKPTA